MRSSFLFFTIFSAIPFSLAFQPAFPYGTEKVRGVNVGGWLVLEVRLISFFSGIAHDASISLG